MYVRHSDLRGAFALTFVVATQTFILLNQIIDRLPMTVDSLKASKLGKLVVKVVKDPPTPGTWVFSFPNFARSRQTALTGKDIIIDPIYTHCHNFCLKLEKSIVTISDSIVFCFPVLLENISNQGYGIECRTQMATNGRKFRDVKIN